MKYLAAIAALLYSTAATPEQAGIEWWQVLGAPCTTKTDREEHTCAIEVKSKPEWR